MAFEIKLIKIC